MKASITLILLGMLFPSFVFSGEIYGIIRESGKSVGQGVRIEITSNNNSYSEETDKYGSYRIYVPEKGQCLLKLYYKEQSPVIAIYSYENSVQYDLILEKKDGQYSLRRK